MYALHEAGLATGAAPLVQAPAGPAEQIERRAVESTEQGSLESDDRYSTLYDITAAVLQLVEGSAQSFAEMLEAMPEESVISDVPENESGDEQPHVDLYA